MAVLAVLAAAAGSMETVEGGFGHHGLQRGGAEGDQATDAWGEYQADSIKKNMYGMGAQLSGANADDLKKESKAEAASRTKSRNGPRISRLNATSWFEESMTHEKRHHWLTISATLIEVGIALSTVAIITKRKPFWFGAVALGVIGATLGRHCLFVLSFAVSEKGARGGTAPPRGIGVPQWKA